MLDLNIEINRNPIVCHRLEHELAFTGVAAIFGQPQMRTCYQRYQPMVTNGQWFGLAVWVGNFGSQVAYENTSMGEAYYELL